MGISYSLYIAGMWPLLPLSVKPKVLGTAYGLCSSIDNLGFAIIPSVMGALTFKSMKANAHFWVHILLGIISILGLACSIWLYFHDKLYNNGELEKSCIKTQEEKSIANSEGDPENEALHLDNRDEITIPLLNPSNLSSEAVVREST